jgi:hypothetical protein
MAKGLIEGWYMVREETLKSFLFKVSVLMATLHFQTSKEICKFLLHILSPLLSAAEAKKLQVPRKTLGQKDTNIQ